MAKPTLFICATCGMTKAPETGKKPANPVSSDLCQSLQQHLGDAVNVKLTTCMSICNSPISFAFCDEERESIAFNHAHTEIPPKDIAQAFESYIAQPVGTKFKKKDMPESLQSNIQARIPVLKD